VIPRVATILSARDWEGNLVAVARETAAIRLVLRAYQPSDIDSHIKDVDIIVAGAETSWVTAAAIASWRRKGLRVIGLHPVADRPARLLLETGGAHAILADDATAAEIIQTARLMALNNSGEPTQPQGQLVAVTGARGAPGRSETALALAWNWASTTDVALIDLDLDAPALAIRTGRPPRPDLSDVAERIRLQGAFDKSDSHHFGAISMVVGSHRPGEGRLSSALVDDVVEASRAAFNVTVMDLEPNLGEDPLVKRSDHAVLVVDGTPRGLVRGARVAAEWAGPPPALVLNKVSRSTIQDSINAARKWTGLEPVAVVPHSKKIMDAAPTAAPPDWGLRKALAHLEIPT